MRNKIILYTFPGQLTSRMLNCDVIITSPLHRKSVNCPGKVYNYYIYNIPSALGIYIYFTPRADPSEYKYLYSAGSGNIYIYETYWNSKVDKCLMKKNSDSCIIYICMYIYVCIIYMYMRLTETVRWTNA